MLHSSLSILTGAIAILFVRCYASPVPELSSPTSEYVKWDPAINMTSRKGLKVEMMRMQEPLRRWSEEIIDATAKMNNDVANADDKNSARWALDAARNRIADMSSSVGSTAQHTLVKRQVPDPQMLHAPTLDPHEPGVTVSQGTRFDYGNCGDFATTSWRDTRDLLKWAFDHGDRISVIGAGACHRVMATPGGSRTFVTPSTAGIYVCNDNKDKIIALTWKDLASYATLIQFGCYGSKGSYETNASGQLFDKRNFNVILAYADELHPSDTRPSVYGGIFPPEEGITVTVVGKHTPGWGRGTPVIRCRDCIRYRCQLDKSGFQMFQKPKDQVFTLEYHESPPVVETGSTCGG